MSKSRASIGGHPIHPVLISLPIGLLTGTVLADIVYLFIAHDRLWLDISFWTNVAGVATALLAAAFGFIDYLGIANGAARRPATAHMLLNLTMVALYTAALFFFPLTGTNPNVLVPFLLQFIGFALMMGAGYLGGELVFKHKLGVVEEDDRAAESERKPSYI